MNGTYSKKIKPKKIVAFFVTFFYLLFNLISTPSFLLAAEMLDANELKTSITEKAGEKTSQINANTSTAPSSEVANQAQIINTGNDVSVNTNTQNSNQTQVNNNNNTQVDQTVNASANTGNNTANGNISINGGGAGIITTGDASVHRRSSEWRH